MLAKVRDLDVAWYGAAAAAAAAGAALVPSSRVAAGLVAGAAVLAIGVWRARKPCCADCADASSPDDRPTVAVDAVEPEAAPRVDFGALDYGAAMFRRVVEPGCAS